MFIHAFIATIAAIDAPPEKYFHDTYVSMVLGASLAGKLVLALLLMFSIISWSIILFKLLELSAVRRDTKKFLEIFYRKGTLSNIYTSGKLLKNSPAAMVFVSAYRDLVDIVKAKSHSGKKDLKDHVEESLSPQEFNEIQRVIQNATSREISRLERKITFLATTGSTAPFIGLFGTVWGVMDSFRAIGLKGAASLGSVAPGIAEALIATAAGLFAAVPAVVAFNYFNSKIRHIGAGIEEFALDFMNLLERKLGR